MVKKSMEDQVVSVIIPAYNYGQFIGDTLACVINQKYTHVEIIVIDDGSTDNTRIVVEQYMKKDSRIKYFYQENSGPSAAKNLGIRKSSGHYIQFLDADDLISVDKLDLQVAHLNADSDLDISYCNGYYFKDKDPDVFFRNLFLTQEEWIPKLDGKSFCTIQALTRNNILPINSALLRKDVIGNIGIFNEGLINLEDWEFWLRCAYANLKFQYLDNEFAFALIRVHKNSLSQNRSRMHQYEIDLRLVMQKWIIAATNLTENESAELKQVNLRNIKILLSLVIKETGILNFRQIMPIAKKMGFTLFLKAYIKTLNDSRKQA